MSNPMRVNCLADEEGVREVCMAIASLYEDNVKAKEVMGLLRVEVNHLLTKLGCKREPGVDMVANFKTLYVAVENMCQENARLRKRLGEQDGELSEGS